MSFFASFIFSSFSSYTDARLRESEARYFWSSGYPFIVWKPVFITAGKGAGEEFLSEFQNSGPSNESENVVSQP